MINSSIYLPVIEQALQQSSKIITTYFRQNIHVDNKVDSSPVTIADKEAELAIRNILSAAFPEHTILGEEHGINEVDSDYCWVIDPIDGTKSFISGYPLFGTLIGLTYQNKPIFGVIDMPILNERWMALYPSHSLFNQHSCQVSKTTQLNKAILYATELNMFEGSDADKFHLLASKVAMRRFGGDCYNYGMLASGHIDLVVEADLKYHDIVALIPVVEQAGGIITDWQGNALNQNFDGRVIAAATPSLHSHVVDILS